MTRFSPRQTGSVAQSSLRGAVGRVLRRARNGRKVPLRQAQDVADGVLPGGFASI